MMKLIGDEGRNTTDNGLAYKQQQVETSVKWPTPSADSDSDSTDRVVTY